MEWNRRLSIGWFFSSDDLIQVCSANAILGYWCTCALFTVFPQYSNLFNEILISGVPVLIQYCKLTQYDGCIDMPQKFHHVVAQICRSFFPHVKPHRRSYTNMFHLWCKSSIVTTLLNVYGHCSCYCQHSLCVKSYIRVALVHCTQASRENSAETEMVR